MKNKSDGLLLDTIFDIFIRCLTMVFLEIISWCIKQFRNKDNLNFFQYSSRSLEKEEKHSNSENIGNFSKVQRRIIAN